MNKEEKVALALLVTLGATALDCRAAEHKQREFEDKFGVNLTEGNVRNVIKKVSDLLSGSEDVQIF